MDGGTLISFLNNGQWRRCWGSRRLEPDVKNDILDLSHRKIDGFALIRWYKRILMQNINQLKVDAFKTDEDHYHKACVESCNTFYRCCHQISADRAALIQYSVHSAFTQVVISNGPKPMCFVACDSKPVLLLSSLLLSFPSFSSHPRATGALCLSDHISALISKHHRAHRKAWT